MCIIVDANKLGGFLAELPQEEAAPIRRWLDRRTGAGILVYSTGGKFADELGYNAKRKLADYSRAGKARFVPENRFAKDEAELKASGELRSDDPHVLALARASGARLLYTGDNKLIADFGNRRIIQKPRGKVYSGAANADLLTNRVCAAPKA